MEREGGDMKRRMSLSASSQLHLSPQVPEHTDTEQINSTLPRHLTSGNITVIPKAERHGIRSSTSSTSSSSVLRGWDAAVVCARGASPSCAFSVLEAALVLLRAPENDIGEDDDGDVTTSSSESPLPQVPPA